MATRPPSPRVTFLIHTPLLMDVELDLEPLIEPRNALMFRHTAVASIPPRLSITFGTFSHSLALDTSIHGVGC